ncbi:hypothetical protein MTO96_009739 [Rhipicephalus appendiculatus]
MNQRSRPAARASRGGCRRVISVRLLRRRGSKARGAKRRPFIPPPISRTTLDDRAGSAPPFAGGRQMHKERKSPCAGFLHKAFGCRHVRVITVIIKPRRAPERSNGGGGTPGRNRRAQPESDCSLGLRERARAPFGKESCHYP